MTPVNDKRHHTMTDSCGRGAESNTWHNPSPSPHGWDGQSIAGGPFRPLPSASVWLHRGWAPEVGVDAWVRRVLKYTDTGTVCAFCVAHGPGEFSRCGGDGLNGAAVGTEQDL